MIDFYHRRPPKRRKKLLGLILLALAAYAVISLFSGSRKDAGTGDFLEKLEDSQQALAAMEPDEPAAPQPAPEPEPVIETTPVTEDEPAGTTGDLLHTSISIRNSLTATLQKSPAIQRFSRSTGLKRLAPMLVSHLQRPLVWQINLGKQIQKDDACSFIFRHVGRKEAAERTDIPDDIEVLAIRYYSLLLKDTLAVYHFRPSGAKYGSFYRADGSMVEKQFNHKVIRDYIQITAPFNENRGYKHQGVDFKAPIGTPVLAPFSGVVSRVNWTRKNNGNCLEIALDRKPYTVKFLHLDRIAVKRRQSIKAGQVVAYSGNTGRSYAPHLHYQVNVGAKGRAVDPMKFHTTYVKKLREADMPAFRAVMKKYDAIMLGRSAAGRTT